MSLFPSNGLSVCWFVCPSLRRSVCQSIHSSVHPSVCPSLSVWLSVCSIWSWFLIHLCKIAISPCIFFKILIFWFVMGVKRTKNGPKWQKIMLITLHISETIQNMIVIYWAHKQNDNFSWCFFVFHFSKFWFFWIGRGLSGKKWSRITKNPVFQAPNLRNHLSYDCHLWYTGVKW